MSKRIAILTAVLAAAFTFPNSLAIADNPTIAGDIFLHFTSSVSGQQTFYTLQSIAPASLVLTLPSVLDISIDPSKLGPGTLNWSNNTNWTTFPLIQSNLSIGSDGGGSYGISISPTFNGLPFNGPTQGAVNARVDFVLGSNTSTNAATTVFSNFVTANYDVTLQSGAHLNDDQFNVTLHNFTINSGASIASANSMVIQNNFTNHGSGGIGGLVQGDFFNDALSTHGDVAIVDYLTVVGHMQNTGELQVSNRLVLHSSSTNSGTIRVNGGTSEVDAALTNTGLFAFSAGNIQGSSTITNNGNFQWSGGNLEIAVVNNSSSFTITGTTAELFGGSITNNSVISQSGGGTFAIAGGAIINNQAGALFNILDDSGTDNGFNGGTFNNAGEFRKSGGTGISNINTTFNSTGIVTVTSGTLSLHGGGSLSGQFNFAGGTTLQLGGGTPFAIQGTLSASGNGTLSLAGPVVNVPAGQSASITNFINGANLLITGGTLGADIGGTLTLNLTGAASIQMSGGNIGGAGSTLNTGNFQMSGGYVVGNLTNSSNAFSITSGSTIYQGNLTNSGSITQAGGLSISGGGTLNNLAGGLYDVQDDSGIISSGPGSITNAGTFRKSGGAGNSYINVPFSSTGIVSVTSGALQLGGSGSFAGSFAFANGGQAQIINSTYPLQGTVSASGSGAFNVAGGTLFVPDGQSATLANFTNGANLLITGGLLKADGSGVLTLNLTGAASVQMSGGSIGGTGSTLNTGNFQFSGGYVAGNLTNASNAFSITGATIYQGNLTNTGTIAQSVGLNISGFGSLNNQLGALYDIRDDSGIFSGGNGGIITNAGTFRKSAGSGNSYINVPFSSTGVISVTSGTLSLGGSGSFAGSFLFGNGGQVQIVNSTYPIQGTVSASGNGAFNVAGGTLFAPDTQSATLANFTNGANLLITGGLLKADGSGVITLNLTGAASVQMSGGSIGGTGSTLNTGNFQFSGGFVTGNFTNSSNSFSLTNSPYIFGGTFINTGTISQSGASAFYVGSLGAFDTSGILDNQATGVYDFLGDQSIFNAFNGGSIHNEGLFRKSGGLGTSNIGAPFNSTGTVDVQSGTLAISYLAQVSGSTLTGGNWIIRANSTLSVGNNVNLTTNQAAITFHGPNSSFPNVASLNNNQGTFKILDGAYFSTTGTFTNSGTFTVDAASTLVAAAGTHFINTGTATLGSDTGSVAASPLSIDNSGNLTLSSTQHLASLANNGGTIAITAGTTKTNALTITNSGTDDITSAKLIIEAVANHDTVFATLQSEVASNAITSSTLPPGFGIAVLDNAVLNKSTFGGESVDANSILMAAELTGDANGDGHVDLNDLNIVLNNLGTTTHDWLHGNFDGAATIDLNDLNDVLNHLGVTNAGSGAVVAAEALLASATPTPEPTSLAVITFILPVFLRRRTKQRV